MALDNDPNKHVGTGQWGDFVGDVGKVEQVTASQRHAAQIAVVEIGGKYDVEVSKGFLSMLGLDGKVDGDDDNCKVDRG